MFLLGNFVRTSGTGTLLQTSERRQRAHRTNGLALLTLQQAGIQAHQIDRRSDRHMMQMRFGQSSTAEAAQPLGANRLGDGRFDACASRIALLERRAPLLAQALFTRLLRWPG